MGAGIFDGVKLVFVRTYLHALNFLLELFRLALFSKPEPKPKQIIVFKVGNIGDTICAVPALIAIRRAYPQARLTLLTSPGERGAVGAQELLDGVWYIDELHVYYADDINSPRRLLELVKNLRGKKIDLFIQLPDDWARFRTLLRNMFFAKAIRARAAFGFKLRTIWAFKKTQVDFLMEKNETEALLEMLKPLGIHTKKVEFEFPIPPKAPQKIDGILSSLWKKDSIRLLIGLCPGGKGREKKWLAENFGIVAQQLHSKYKARFVLFGGPGDEADISTIKRFIPKNALLDSRGLTLLECLEMLKRCNFLLTNDNGIMHAAAAVGTPTVALFSVRSVLGKWFPYGTKHKILYHRFLNCDYKKEECIKESINMITTEEVLRACDELISL